VCERDGKEERVLNQEETLAARDKQKQIKERFRAWIFTDVRRESGVEECGNTSGMQVPDEPLELSSMSHLMG